MKRTRKTQEMTPLNGSAFRVDAAALRREGLEALLESTLRQVFGRLGDEPATTSSCTVFSCNIYAPPPPPPNG